MRQLTAILVASFFLEVLSGVDDVCAGPASTRPYLQKTTHASVYDKYERPGARSGKPDTIEVQFVMTQMNQVDELLGQVTVGGYFRTYWTDTRLAYNNTANGGCLDTVNLGGEAGADTLWKPDLYIDNLVGKSTGIDDSLYSISPDGSVWHSRQVLFTVKCPMSFGRLPFDKQECMLSIASYSMDISQVRVMARNGQIGLGSSGEGIKMEDGLTSPVWSMEPGESLQACDVEVRNFGPNLDWDYLLLRWSFERKPGYFLYQVMIPDFLFLIISYSAFFVDAHAAPARAAMAIIPVLTTVTLSNSVHRSLPQISDSMWISDYLLTSMILSCLAAVHFSVVQFRLIVEKKRQGKLRDITSIEKVAKELIDKVRGDGMSLLNLLNRYHPPKMPKEPLLDFQSEPSVTASQTFSGVVSFSLGRALLRGPPQKDTTEGASQEVATDEPVDEAPEVQPVSIEIPRTDSERSDRTSRCPSTPNSLQISEVELSVIMFARDMFIKVDKHHTNQLKPREVRVLLRKFNLYWSEESTAMVMCMFLRDHNVRTPVDEMNATISLGLFIEFLTEVSHYSLAVHRSVNYPWSKSISPSEQCDVFMRWFFPWLLISKMVIFLALIDKYPRAGI